MMSRDRGFDVPREMGLVSGFISDGEIVLCFTASFFGLGFVLWVMFHWLICYLWFWNGSCCDFITAKVKWTIA